MQCLVRFDVHQPEDMSNREFLEMWDREADAALGAMEAGAVTHLWKVSGQRVVIGVLELPDAESVDRALAGLPIIKGDRRHGRDRGAADLRVLDLRGRYEGGAEGLGP
jgi:muconolactone delta-isomerase